MSRKKLSRDQKRKKKLAKRNRDRSLSIEPYRGNKYKSEKFVEAIFAAEAGIYEAYVITDRELTDRQVEESLAYLIRQLRGEQPAPPASNPQSVPDDGPADDLVAWSIKDRWTSLFADRPRHSNADLAGVLRTILGSIRVWSRPGPNSRGYLHYIEGFLTRAGLSVEAMPANQLPADETEAELEAADAGEPRDEELLTELGDAWVETGDPLLKEKFLAEANALLNQGRPGPVIEVSQRLIGRSNDADRIGELEALIKAAWKQEPPRPRRRSPMTWVHKLVSRWR